MTCKRCGEVAIERTKFCIKCGASMIAPGRTFLKVTGIIYIISGTFGLFGLAMLDSIPNITDTQGMIGLSEINMPLIIVSSIIGILVNIIIGIFSIKYCDNIEKAQFLKYLIIFYFIYFIASTIFTSIVSTFNWIGLFGIVLPILSFVGIQKNLKSKIGG